jgi:hypothetical protein
LTLLTRSRHRPDRNPAAQQPPAVLHSPRKRCKKSPQPILGDYTIDMHESDNEFSEATQGLLATVKAIGPFDQFI